MKVPRAVEECCLPDCHEPARAAGRCGIHYQELRREHPEEIERLKGLSPSERAHHFYMLKHPLPPKWEYTNDFGEEWLAKRAAYIESHPSLPILMTWEEVDELIRQDEQNQATRRSDNRNWQ